MVQGGDAQGGRIDADVGFGLFTSRVLPAVLPSASGSGSRFLSHGEPLGISFSARIPAIPGFDPIRSGFVVIVPDRSSSRR